MSGWVPMPAEVWPVVVEHYPKPWADEACAFDLRWHVDQRGAVPSRRDLAKRWGWTPDEVKTLLRHTERWWDPAKGEAPASREQLKLQLVRKRLAQRGPARPKPAQPGPATTDQPGKPRRAGPARPNPAQPGPPWPQRGDPPSPSPSPDALPLSQSERAATDPAELVYKLLVDAVPDPDPGLYGDIEEGWQRVRASRAELWQRAARGDQKLAEDVLVAERGRLEVAGIRRWPKVAALLVRLAQERAPP